MLDPRPKSSTQLGFTLVEFISTLVILGIVAAIGSSFLFSVSQSYAATETRAKLIARGRLAIEQMTRQLRMALPNASRVSASGNCIEFLPILGGANYLQNLPDAENGAAAVASINTSPFTISSANGAYVVVAPLFSSEIYTTSVPSSRAQIGTLGISPYTVIPLSAPHRFNRNSINKRLFIVGQPRRFCLDSGNLVEYSNYSLLTSALNDANPGGVSSLIAAGVSASGNAFSLSAGSAHRNAAVLISLQFEDRGEQVMLNNTVLVRNVP